MKKLCLILVAALLAGAAAQAVTVTEVETVTGGTFLNFSSTADTRNGLTMTSVLGASVPDPRTTTSNVNWNLDDTSDSAWLVNGKGVDDDARSNSPWSSSNPAPPWAGPDYNPITVTIGGLVANGVYELKMVSF